MLENFETLRPRLFGIAYRMLGTVMDAEDAVQEAFLRAEQAMPNQLQAEGAYLRSTLIHICINQLKSARSQRESYIGPWLPSPLVTSEPDPAEQMGKTETLSFAFLLLCERLSPDERAVFTLREAFDYGYAELAQMLGKSEAACRKLYSRAKHKIGAALPDESIPSEQYNEVFRHFFEAIQTGDLNAVAALLSEDIIARSDGGGKVSAAIHPLVGARTVGSFMLGLMRFLRPEHVIEVQMLNGRPSVILREADRSLITVILADVQGGKLSALYLMRNPEKIQHLK